MIEKKIKASKKNSQNSAGYRIVDVFASGRKNLWEWGYVMKYYAKIDETGKYRYLLGREWDADKGKMLFVMLNPSTADAEKDDNTISRCINWSKALSFGGIEVVNLFAYRTAYPKEFKACKTR